MDGDQMDYGQSVAEVVLELVSHYRLRDKPARTLEALRIFLDQQADSVYDELRAGRAVVVSTGPRREVEQMGQSMQAQGFVVRVREVRPAASG